jgi:hypothetical protein
MSIYKERGSYQKVSVLHISLTKHEYLLQGIIVVLKPRLQFNHPFGGQWTAFNQGSSLADFSAGLKQPGSPSDGEELQGGIQWMDFWIFGWFFDKLMGNNSYEISKLGDVDHPGFGPCRNRVPHGIPWRILSHLVPFYGYMVYSICFQGNPFWGVPDSDTTWLQEEEEARLSEKARLSAFRCQEQFFDVLRGKEIGHSGGDEDSYRYFNHQSRHI